MSFGTLGKVPIKNVNQLYEEMNDMVSNMVNVWSWGHRTSTQLKIKLSGSVEIKVCAGDTGLSATRSAAKTPPQPPYSVSLPRFLLAMSPWFAEVTQAGAEGLQIAFTPHFEHISLYLKLRWLLHLHSAMCELDHKLCSLNRFVKGLQTIMCSESSFADGVSHKKGPGAPVSLDLILNDLLLMIQKSLGVSCPEFLHFVQTCDPMKALMTSTRDTELPRVTSNHELAESLGDVYLVHLLRQPPPLNLMSVMIDLQRFMLPLPDLVVDPVASYQLANNAASNVSSNGSQRKRLTMRVTSDFRSRSVTRATLKRESMSAGGQRGADNSPPEQQDLLVENCPEFLRGLFLWAFATNSASRNKYLSIAQRQAVHLATLVELQCLDGSHPLVFELLCVIVAFHFTYPQGMRKRLLNTLLTSDKLSVSQKSRLEKCSTINRDLPNLSVEQLEAIKVTEHLRLMRHSTMTGMIVNHLMLPPMAGMPMEEGKTAAYWALACAPEFNRRASESQLLDSKVAESFAKAVAHGSWRSQAFVVSKQKGPYLWDEEAQKMRHQPLFGKIQS